MRIFLYEYITGGGMLTPDTPEPLLGSLLTKGSAMIGSLAADFCRIPDVRVHALRDHRLGDFQLPGCQVHDVCDPNQQHDQYSHQVTNADWTVVIAPEFDGILLERTQWVIAAGGRLLSPGPPLVQLASDKQRTAEHLQAAGVPVPHGIALASTQPLPADFTYPAVVKPRDGAGSLGVSLVKEQRHVNLNQDKDSAQRRRLEQYCPGTAVSVAFLCGPSGDFNLPPCLQILSDDGRFIYLGGRTPLADDLAERATRLARAAISTLPERLGYLGVDLVLGENSQGRDDVVIEINPRLTTSYVGLRAAAEVNLAAAMLQIVQGNPAELSFGPQRVEFLADGAITV